MVIQGIRRAAEADPAWGVRMIERDMGNVERDRYDVVVVGGGIYGIATLLEASRRGLRAVLLERGDFGGGTSWNSLRILHGGLRYLQSLDVTRFRESVCERRWFCLNFPEWVRPLPCLMPLYGRGLKRTSAMRTALWMNDHLSRRRNDGVAADLHLPDGELLDAEQTAKRFEHVQRRGLQGAALWHDAVMVNSQRVVMEMLRWACDCGGRALNYVEATEVAAGDGAVRGVTGRCTLTGRTLAVDAAVVVNCAGPGASAVVRGLAGEGAAALFRPSLAFNVLLDRPVGSPVAVAVQAPAAEAAMRFVQPWRGRMLAGTVHLPWSGAAGDGTPSAAQVQAFLDELNAAVPAWALTADDVTRVYAGLLPAAAEGSATLAKRPIVRDHGDHGGPRGLVSVSGVKFTTARRVAEQALTQAWKERGGLPAYQPRSERRASARPIDLTDPQQLFSGDERCTRAALTHIVQQEAVIHMEDLLLRRSDWACDPAWRARVEQRVHELTSATLQRA